MYNGCWVTGIGGGGSGLPLKDTPLPPGLAPPSLPPLLFLIEGGITISALGSALPPLLPLVVPEETNVLWKRCPIAACFVATALAAGPSCCCWGGAASGGAAAAAVDGGASIGGGGGRLPHRFPPAGIVSG